MASAPAVDIGTLIVTKPGFRGGRPCLRGTGMTVHAVASLYEQGLSAGEIQQEFEDLDLGLIHAALAFYLVNQGRVHSDWAADREREQTLQDEHPRGWSTTTSE